MKIKDFKVGEVYTRDNIIEAFGGSMMRGMDFSKEKKVLIKQCQTHKMWIKIFTPVGKKE